MPALSRLGRPSRPEPDERLCRRLGRIAASFEPWRGVVCANHFICRNWSSCGGNGWPVRWQYAECGGRSRIGLMWNVMMGNEGEDGEWLISLPCVSEVSECLASGALTPSPSWWSAASCMAKAFARGHDSRLPGRPDIVLQKYKVVVFVHGCFWHAHRCQKGRLPEIDATIGGTSSVPAKIGTGDRRLLCAEWAGMC